MDKVAIVIEAKSTRATRAAVQTAVSYLREAGYETPKYPLSRAVDLDLRNLQVDFVLLASGSRSVVGELKTIHGCYSRACVLVALESFDTDVVAKLYTAGAAVVAPTRAFGDAVRHMLVTVETQSSEPKRTPAAHHPIEDSVVQRFHDPATGRLDAKQIAETYAISVSALAKALNLTQSALSKLPTAPAAQGGLRELEFAWATLVDLLGNEEKARAWLNSKRLDLNGRPPINLLIHGSAEALANYVRSVVAGEPG